MNTDTFRFCLFAVLMTLSLIMPVKSNAEVSVSIGINSPPPPVYVVPAPPPPVPVYAVPAPPEVVVIPGSYVYYVPNIGVDILFYHGSWYRPHGGNWYRARSYNGPWVHVVPRRVPRALVSLPHDYRHRHPPGRPHIPYGQLKKNWAKWERDKHWDRHDNRGGDGRGRHDDRGRGDHKGR